MKAVRLIQPRTVAKTVGVGRGDHRQLAEYYKLNFHVSTEDASNGKFDTILY